MTQWHDDMVGSQTGWSGLRDRVDDQRTSCARRNGAVWMLGV